MTKQTATVANPRGFIRPLRREKLIQLLASGMKPNEAYVTAGYNGNATARYVVLNSHYVVSKVAALKAKTLRAKASPVIPVGDTDDLQTLRGLLGNHAIAAQNAGDFKSSAESLRLIAASLGVTEILFRAEANHEESRKKSAAQQSKGHE